MILLIFLLKIKVDKVLDKESVDLKVFAYANIPNSEIEPFIAVKRDNFQQDKGKHLPEVLCQFWFTIVLLNGILDLELKLCVNVIVKMFKLYG